MSTTHPHSAAPARGTAVELPSLARGLGPFQRSVASWLHAALAAVSTAYDDVRPDGRVRRPARHGAVRPDGPGAEGRRGGRARAAAAGAAGRVMSVPDAPDTDGPHPAGIHRAVETAGSPRPAGRSGRRHRGATLDRPADPSTSGPLRLVVRDVHVVGRRAPMLHLETLTLATGECVLVAGEPGQGHTALALVATGRLAPFEGSVVLTAADGSASTARDVLRRVSGVVDLPGISEPDDTLTTATVVAEELALARTGSRRAHVHRWLESHELATYRDVRMDDLPGPVRTALLTSLTAERPGVRFLVISLPDRHGGEPAAWWSIAQAFAARGYGVLVQCSRSSARELGATLEPARGDASQRATPVESLRTGVDEMAESSHVPELTVDLDERPPAADGPP